MTRLWREPRNTSACVKWKHAVSFSQQQAPRDAHECDTQSNARWRRRSAQADRLARCAHARMAQGFPRRNFRRRRKLSARASLRISNTNTGNHRLDSSVRCENLNFRFVVEHIHRTATKPIDVVRLVGGLAEHLRFFHSVDPAISRKRDIAGQAVKSYARLGVVSIEPLGKAMRLYDITTGTEDFIANGVVSHNCYARPSHAYVGLSPGLDFETKLFYKADAAARARERARGAELQMRAHHAGRQHRSVPAARKNTQSHTFDSRGAARATSTRSTSPPRARWSRATSTCWRELARDGLTRVMFSIPTLDNEMKRVLEPRARVRRGRNSKRCACWRKRACRWACWWRPSFPCSPNTKSKPCSKPCREAGASLAGYTMLRLPWEVKDLFREWLAEHFPDRAAHVMSIVREHARRTRQRPRLWDAHARHRTGGAADSPAFPARLPAARLSVGPAKCAADESFSPATTYSPSVVARSAAVSSSFARWSGNPGAAGEVTK